MPVKRLKGSWWIDVQYNHQRLRKRSPLNTREGALAFEATIRRDIIVRGSVVAVLSAFGVRETEKLTFSAFSVRWMRDYVAANNKFSEVGRKRLALKTHLLPAFGHLALAEITTESIERYKAEKQGDGLSAKTVNNHITVLGRCLAIAVEWGLLATAPRCRPLKALCPPFSFLSPAQAEALIATATPGLWRAMVLIALRTGMRFSELIALRWDSIDPTQGTLCVRGAMVRGQLGTPKNDRIRYIPLSEELATMLAKLPRVGPLVFSIEGRWIRHKVARLRLRRFCRAAEIPDVGWHALRHTFASHLVAAGVPLTAVKELLGHATISMTLRYAHLAPHHLRDAINTLGTSPAATTWRQPPTISPPTRVLTANTLAPENGSI